MEEHIWESFDSLFKTVHKMGRCVEELEARIVSLEKRLGERERANDETQDSVEVGAQRP